MKIEQQRLVIAGFGFKIIWRNSNTKRYLRFILWLFKKQYSIDLFRKEKV